jgi:hypothetical protein
MARPRSFILLRASCVAFALALPVAACASQPDSEAAAADPQSLARVEERIAVLRAEMAQGRAKVAAMLSVAPEDGSPLSEDAEFRALADHLVELELQLEELEDEKAAFERRPPADPYDGQRSE